MDQSIVEGKGEGAGFYINNIRNNIYIFNNTFHDNIGPLGVGGWISNSKYAEIKNCTFKNHSSFKSGALHLENLENFLV